MSVLIISIGLFFVGALLVFGSVFALLKRVGFGPWWHAVSVVLGCALLAVSMLPLGVQVGRGDAVQQLKDAGSCAPQAGDPSLPTADPLAPGEYIVFATVAMDPDAAGGHPCFAVVAPVYGNDVDADAMRIHMLTDDGPCFVTDIIGERWRLRAVPMEDGSTQFIAIIPSYGDACAPEDDAMPAVPDMRVTPGSSSL